jgi:hypothetical protein
MAAKRIMAAKALSGEDGENGEMAGVNVQSMAWRNVENISSDMACAIIGAVMKTENWLFNGMASVMAYHGIAKMSAKKHQWRRKRKRSAMA